MFIIYTLSGLITYTVNITVSDRSLQSRSEQFFSMEFEGTEVQLFIQNYFRKATQFYSLFQAIASHPNKEPLGMRKSGNSLWSLQLWIDFRASGRGTYLV